MVVEAEHKDQVRIHIDQQPYESPNPTTGEALYVLGNVKPGLELYREVAGNREDKPIPKSKEHIHLKEDEHFHSGEPHKFTIIVNARKKTVTLRGGDVRADRGSRVRPYSSQLDLHGHLLGRRAPPGRNSEAGPEGQNQRRDGVQCHRNWSIITGT